MPNLSFLIVNYFTSNYVEALVRSILSFVKELEYEILIFDNSCDINEKENLEKLKEEFSFVKIYNINLNIGFVKANNYLFKNANGKVIILVNPDTLLIDESIILLIKLILNNKEISIAGPKLLNDDGSYQTSFYKFPTLISLIKEHILLFKRNVYEYKRDINEIQDCDVIKGACIAFNRTLIEGDTIFDEDYTMYSEETDFCKKAKVKNKRVVYFPKTQIKHYGEKSSSRDEISEYSLYNYYRSKFIFFKKYYNKIIYRVAWIVLLTSLIEKTSILFLFNKKRSSRLHWNVFLKIWKDVKNLSNM